MANEPPTPAPARLMLPEVVELLVAHFECTEEHARSLLKRAVYGGSLRDIKTFYPDGMEFETDIPAWREIDWDDGIVMIEPSWAGSPAERLPVYPLFALEEVCSHFHIDIDQERPAAQRRRGRPVQYEWDAFWVEVCRRTRGDGLPETQAELVDNMLDWFLDRGREAIDPRTIEKKISKLFAELRPE